MSQHNTYISAAKGLVIILMVIGHSGAPSSLAGSIYLFHMPCFFLISGYLFKEKHLNDTKTFILKKAKGLYLPFVKWSLIFLLFHNILYHLNLYGIKYNTSDFLSKVFHILTMTGSEQLLGGFWFLKELLYASIISFFVFKLLQTLKLNLKLSTLIVCSLLFVLLAFIQSVITFKIPIIGSKTLLATSYFIAGVALSKIDNTFIDLNKLKVGIILLITFVISSFFVRGGMDEQGYSIFPYYATSVIGSVAVIYLIKYLGKRVVNVLDYVGKKTLYILIFHFISFKLVTLVLIMIAQKPLTELTSFPVIGNGYSFSWVIYSIVGVIIPLLIEEGMNRFSLFWDKRNFLKRA